MKKLFAIFMIAMMLMCFMPSAAFADQISTNSAPMTSGVQIGKYYEVDDNSIIHTRLMYFDLKSK